MYTIVYAPGTSGAITLPSAAYAEQAVSIIKAFIENLAGPGMRICPASSDLLGKVYGACNRAYTNKVSTRADVNVIGDGYYNFMITFTPEPVAQRLA